ncbi:unnamed protein product [Microthlaspi erraticum]|uniref:Uncharacterized protein n=1 Tax=Microthlaspi erraticum TaxID=1685480 RepID=A0A6D2IHX6_9BRAS|nr:unnamed protein product [Microthlaspi erraticum]
MPPLHLCIWYIPSDLSPPDLQNSPPSRASPENRFFSLRRWTFILSRYLCLVQLIVQSLAAVVCSAPKKLQRKKVRAEIEAEEKLWGRFHETIPLWTLEEEIGSSCLSSKLVRLTACVSSQSSDFGFEMMYC